MDHGAWDNGNRRDAETQRRNHEIDETNEKKNPPFVYFAYFVV
jgi:hypothetical protein